VRSPLQDPIKFDPGSASVAMGAQRPSQRVFWVPVHPLLRNVGLTGITTLLTSIAAIAVISLIGRVLGPVLLGEYLLVRRMASWLQAVVALPSGVALPRYVAASVDEPPATSRGYFFAAMVGSSGLALLLIAGFLAWKGPSSKLLFGSERLSTLALPLGILLLGLALHGAVFGFYQGKLSMGRACMLQFCNLAIVPVVVVIWLARKHSIPMIVYSTGVAMMWISVLFAVPVMYRVRFSEALRHARKRVTELLSFGLSRAWGDFGLQALLSLPAVIAAHYVSLQSVGYLLLGGSLLAVVAAATLPIGMILLSQVSRSLAQGRTAQLKKNLPHFVDGLIECSLFGCLQMLVFTDSILAIWLGSGFSEAVRIVRLLIVAIPFYFVYGGLRSIVDAAALKAYNTRNILISLVLFLIAVVPLTIYSAPRYLLEGLAASVVAALGFLAWLTWRTVRRLFQIHLPGARVLPGFSLALTLGGGSFLLHNVLRFQPGLAALIFYQTTLLVVYFAALWRLRSPWLQFLGDLFRSDQSFNPRTAA